MKHLRGEFVLARITLLYGLPRISQTYILYDRWTERFFIALTVILLIPYFTVGR